MKQVVVRLLALCSLLLAAVIVPSPRAVRASGGGGPLCYVDQGAAGINDGSSWANAFTDLQFALVNVSCTEIWVKAGVYKPGSTPSDTFAVLPGVAVYGGFAGTETLRSQRNPALNVTILTGDADNNDINTDGNHIDETTADIQGNNSYHVVTFDGTTTAVTSSTVLDGFTITGGNANSSFPNDGGGGISCKGGGAGSVCSPDLEHLTFSGNFGSFGGAIRNYAEGGGTSSPTVSNVTFSGNAAGTWGGAIDDDGNSGTSSPSISDALFTGNSAIAGGAIYNDGSSGASSPSLTNVTFYNNSAGLIGGAIENQGGSGSSSPSFLNVTFSHNHSGSSGGAMTDNGTGGGSAPSLVNVILFGDTATSSGPEISNVNATPAIEYSLVQGSGGSGGSWDTALGTDLGNNLDADPMLALPAKNGGYTQTMALIWGSPAIDTGLDAVCPADDQRGVFRWQGPHCDMGAYERIPPVARADFDASGTSDLSVFRPSTGVWYIKNVFNTTWGTTGDVPVPANYTGAGYYSVATWRPSTGIWYIKGLLNSAWGQSGDVPVPGDYNGDGHTDVAVWRPSNGTWYVKNQFTTAWGQSGDIPVPADYNGDGKTELAVFRPSTGTWYIKGVGNFAWGTSTDIPVPADYNGDGRVDLAIYRPSTGVWYIKGVGSFTWGSSTDIPVPGDFNADGKADVAIWRPSTGQWMVKNEFTMTWGVSGDFPVVAPDTNGNGTPYQ